MDKKKTRTRSRVSDSSAGATALLGKVPAEKAMEQEARYRDHRADECDSASSARFHKFEANKRNRDNRQSDGCSGNDEKEKGSVVHEFLLCSFYNIT